VTTALIVATLRDGRRLRLSCPCTNEELAALEHSPTETEFRLFDRAFAAERLVEEKAHVKSWRLEQITTSSFAGEGRTARGALIRGSAAGETRRSRQVARCRSLLEIGNLLLPPGVRDDALDEWMDEIECAAAKNRPVLPRVVSILRTLPLLAWRSRLARARRRGG
jgi:hypothetical protein